MQDGLDLVTALAGSPDTARYLATKLYRFFVSEFGGVSGAFVDRIANVYLQNRFEMRPVLREVLMSPEFWDSGVVFLAVRLACRVRRARDQGDRVARVLA